jgi:CRISPR system Cascade subunit CasB
MPSERSGEVTTETIPAWQRQEQAFIAALDQLDAGGRARLKRNAGRTLAEAHDGHRVFFQALPYDIHERAHEDYFLIATLFPLVAHRHQAGSLGTSLRQVRHLRGGAHDGRTNSLDRRVQALLDSDREQLPFRLRQAVRLIAAEREHVALDWARLLRDVRSWEHPERRVQLRWARDYFVGVSAPSTESHSDETEGGHV